MRTPVFRGERNSNSSREIRSAIRNPRLTPEQYLAIERASETKSEYFDGEIFAMSGGLLPHAVISLALAAELRAALRGVTCHAAGSDLRVGVSRQGPFFYPDVSVYCGEPQLADEFRDMLLNPTLVIEVPSPSSEAYDRGRKFAAYRRIAPLREYVLVSQTSAMVEVYLRGADERWTLTEFSAKDAFCRFESIGCDIALAEIYRDVL